MDQGGKRPDCRGAQGHREDTGIPWVVTKEQFQLSHGGGGSPLLTSPPATSISSLPDPVLAQLIFSRLHWCDLLVMERVCRRFCRVSRREVWPRVRRVQPGHGILDPERRWRPGVEVVEDGGGMLLSEELVLSTTTN
jgi:hypothetical protein